jgi:hypothetical protein
LCFGPGAGCGNGGFHVCADIDRFVVKSPAMSRKVQSITFTANSAEIHICQVDGDHRVEPLAMAMPPML